MGSLLYWSVTSIQEHLKINSKSFPEMIAFYSSKREEMSERLALYHSLRLIDQMKDGSGAVLWLWDLCCISLNGLQLDER